MAFLIPLFATLALVQAGTPATCSTTSTFLSCSGSSTNTCCINSPGGLFQQVQFWDTDPSTGPSNSWTIHGLWPNNCDGTYSENCDSSRAYTDITTLLQNAGETSTLSYMQTYWISDDESNEKFWEHEWATHGTCISTLKPSCYSGYKTGEEAVDFFVKVVDLFKGLPTYTVSPLELALKEIKLMSFRSGWQTQVSRHQTQRHTRCQQWSLLSRKPSVHLSFCFAKTRMSCMRFTMDTILKVPFKLARSSQRPARDQKPIVQVLLSIPRSRCAFGNESRTLAFVRILGVIEMLSCIGEAKHYTDWSSSVPIIESDFILFEFVHSISTCTISSHLFPHPI